MAEMGKERGRLKDVWHGVLVVPDDQGAKEGGDGIAVGPMEGTTILEDAGTFGSTAKEYAQVVVDDTKTINSPEAVVDGTKTISPPEAVVDGTKTIGPPE